ncbi:MAG: hypothetical protein ACYSUC_01780, partial [Planctomycetota bacterium]
TGYEDAAIMLSEHHFERKLKRSRIEVVSADIQEISDAQLLTKAGQVSDRTRWDKSRIVKDLVTKHDVCRQTARTIASMVEEKIFKMGITLVPASLIKQIVLGDAVAVLRAERQLFYQPFATSQSSPEPIRCSSIASSFGSGLFRAALRPRYQASLHS